MVWSVLCGVGVFSGYVPIGAMYYDRLVGALRCPATAVFMINLSDSAGYIGTIVLVLYKNFGGIEDTNVENLGAPDTENANSVADASYRAFFRTCTLWAGLLLCVFNIFGLYYWPREFRRCAEETHGALPWRSSALK